MTEAGRFFGGLNLLLAFLVLSCSSVFAINLGGVHVACVCDLGAIDTAYMVERDHRFPLELSRKLWYLLVLDLFDDYNVDNKFLLIMPQAPLFNSTLLKNLGPGLPYLINLHDSYFI